MLLKSLFYSERFTLQTSGRQREKLTVVLAHSPQIIKRYPEVKSSLKQTQAVISKWLIHLFMQVVHNTKAAASTVWFISATNTRAFKSGGRETATLNSSHCWYELFWRLLLFFSFMAFNWGHYYFAGLLFLFHLAIFFTVLVYNWKSSL